MRLTVNWGGKVLRLGPATTFSALLSTTAFSIMFAWLMVIERGWWVAFVVIIATIGGTLLVGHINGSIMEPPDPDPQEGP